MGWSGCMRVGWLCRSGVVVGGWSDWVGVKWLGGGRGGGTGGNGRKDSKSIVVVEVS